MRTLFVVLQWICAGPPWTAFACFVSSMGVLGLVELPWISIVNCVIWIALVSVKSDPQWSPAMRAYQYMAPLVLCIASILFHPYLSATLVAGWMLFLAAVSHKDMNSLRQFAYTILTFIVVDTFLLKHSTVDLLLADLAHGYSRLIRDSYGDGDVVSPFQMGYRLLIFSIILTIPFTSRGVRPWLLTLCQTSFVIILIPLRIYVHPWTAEVGSGISACILVGLLLSDASNCGDPVRMQGEWATKAARIVGLLSVMIQLIVGGASSIEECFGRPIQTSVGTGDLTAPVPSILFLNDHDNSGKEGDERDMTHFDRGGTLQSARDFDEDRRHPLYDKLTKRFLPALGYQVSVRRPEEVNPKEYARHQLVVLISLQNNLPAAHRQALYQCVVSGKTNVLIAGDHTDIRGVRGPFNDIMAPLGVELNYDSAIPFGQWYSQIVYCLHPVNGPLALAAIGQGGDPGVSVGASLTLDWTVARPVLEAADGFADQGTPDAPMFAGLGDMVYTPNEVRGGLILAAERPYGRGTVMAFGDTSFLQNGSICRDFAYVASVFEYLTQRRGVLDTKAFGLLALFCGAIAVSSLARRFSWSYAYICICMWLMSIFVTGTWRDKTHVICRLKDNIMIVDTAHGENLRPYDRKKSVSIIADLLDRRASLLTLEADALGVLNTGRIKGVLLLEPRGSFSAEEQHRLVQFVMDGGRLVFASSYSEAFPHTPWLLRFGCQITPVTLGAGQQVSLVDKSYQQLPTLTEAWGLELGDGWRGILTCYEIPVVALRDYGKGRVCIVADGGMLLDGSMGVQNSTNEGSFAFVSRILDQLDLRIGRPGF